MKRFKFLLAATAATISLGISAQSWTGGAGRVYLKNVGAGLYWGAGNSWDTEASLVSEQQYVTLEENGDGTYRMKSMVNNGGNSYYFNGSYMDSNSPVSLTITSVGEGLYTIGVGTSLYGYNGVSTILASDLSAGDKNAWWKGFTQDEIEAANQSLLQTASPGQPVDATCLILDPSFGRNRMDASEVWNMVANNQNLKGGAPNGCAESYHSTFTLSQTIRNAPKGTYSLTVQAFYRQDGTDGQHLPYFYMNDVQGSTFPTIAYGENSMDAAGNSFASGRYLLDPVFIELGEGEALTVGAKLEGNTTLWVCWDNFRLTYYGDVTIAEAKLGEKINALGELISSAKALDGHIPSAAYAGLHAIVDDNDKEYDSEAGYDAAISALTEAIAKVQPLTGPYSFYKAAKGGVEALDDDTDLFTGNATIDVASIAKIAEEATSVEAIEAATEQMRAAATQFLSAIEVNEGKSIDLTQAFVTNPAPWHDANGWNYPVEPAMVTTDKVGEFYMTNGAFLSQTLAVLPAGYYTLTAHALARSGCTPIYLFANEDNKQELVKKSEAEINTTAQASALFTSDGGLNTLTFALTEAGVVTIGLKSEFEPTGAHGDANDGWMTWRDFTLCYLGLEPLPVLVSAYETAKAEAEAARDNVEYMNVQGEERAALLEAIADTPEQTAASYREKAAALTAATTTFTDPSVVKAWNGYTEYFPAEKAKADVISKDLAEGIAQNVTNATEAAQAVDKLNVAVYEYVIANYSNVIALPENWQPAARQIRGQHWSDDASVYYLEQPYDYWTYESWDIYHTMSFSLPAGDYIFKVAGRRSTYSTLRVDITDEDNGVLLGTADNFPDSNDGRGYGINRGITVDGEASFTDGTFANNGIGWGWQWRFIPFTLTATTNVQIVVSGEATAMYQWVSFCDYGILTNADTYAISKLKYDLLLAEAKRVKDSATYNNVKGTDRSNLTAAINADPGLTKARVDAAIKTLEDALNTFTAGVTAWNAYANSTENNPYYSCEYATSAKRDAMQTAWNATVNTAAEAEAQAAIIIQAKREVAESHAMAEGVADAVDMTACIEQANAPASLEDITAWNVDLNVIDPENGAFYMTTSTELALVQADGTTGTPFYHSGTLQNANIYAVDFNQEVSLQPGRYLLTIAARGSYKDSSSSYSVLKTFKLYAGTAETGINKRFGYIRENSIYDYGWQDYSLEFTVEDGSQPVRLGIYAESQESGAWFSFNRFRLVQLNAYLDLSEDDTEAPAPRNYGKVTLKRTLKAGQWNSFSVPFNISRWTTSETFSALQFKRAEGNEIVLTEATSIEAGVPYLVIPNSGQDLVNPTFTSVTVGSTEEVIKGDGDYRFAAHLYNTPLPTDGSVAYLSNSDSTIKKLTSGGIKGLRAYFQIPISSEAKGLILRFDDGTNRILTVNAEGYLSDSETYNLAGQRVSNLSAERKGVYIVGGKKRVVK